MPVPSLPSEYDETRHVQAGRADCHITSGSIARAPVFIGKA